MHNELHRRKNEYRSDSYKFLPSVDYYKSTVELEHFNLHDCKTTTIETPKIQKKSLN